MQHRLIVIYIFLLTALAGPTVSAQSTPDAKQICGRWSSSEQNLIIQVYEENSQLKAKIIWFNDPTDTSGQPIKTWTDVHNPNKSLRTRKLVGMDVLENIKYDNKTNSWEDGIIYDAKHGKYWNASAYLTRDGLLKVTGYWHFKFIGRTMVFKRV